MRSELANAHLFYGAKLRAAALSAVPRTQEELSQIHHSVVIELNRALNIFQSLGKRCRLKCAAVHYHLGSYFLWSHALPLETPKAFKRAEYHLKAALRDFGEASMEGLMCRIDLARLYAKTPMISLKALASASGREAPGNTDNIWGTFRAEMLGILKELAKRNVAGAKVHYRAWLLETKDFQAALSSLRASDLCM